jgi:protein SSD1
MLPALLSERACSLNAGAERLAFSVVFTLNEEGELVEGLMPRFGKSIINSCAKLNYDIVQKYYNGEYSTKNFIGLS